MSNTEIISSGENEDTNENTNEDRNEINDEEYDENYYSQFNDDYNENHYDLFSRKIMKFMRQHSSNIGDHYNLRLFLLRLFYYDINGIPIAKLKPENEIDFNNYPKYFKYKNRLEIIDIYNKNIKAKSLLKIYSEDEFNNYDIIEKNYLEISLKTFRPVYKDNWKEISEELNNTPIDKQKNFYADYLKCYLKLKYFPSFDEFIKFIYNKYQMPVHKDIKIAFDNIEKSYIDVKEYIERNLITFKDVSKIIKDSTSISNRIMMQSS
jgi:hypothetical protein